MATATKSQVEQSLKFSEFQLAEMTQRLTHTEMAVDALLNGRTDSRFIAGDFTIRLVSRSRRFHWFAVITLTHDEGSTTTEAHNAYTWLATKRRQFAGRGPRDNFEEQILWLAEMLENRLEELRQDDGIPSIPEPIVFG